jgi:2-oxoglutarate dehydrogenase E1 component
VVIDQFISSGEQKWGRLCGLTLYLPHGYEGQGAEHSSARLERYLQLCAEHNIQVCVPTTPAQVFHMIRRQMVRPIRKPLIVLTPKSLLRHKLAVSRLQELETGEFFPVLSEVDNIQSEQVKRVILCSGKVYYDLLQKRRADNQKEIAILRVEQLYPFPEIELKAQLDLYSAALVVVWCQEEPKNQGAWYNIQHHLVAVISQKQQLQYAGRQAAAAPAVGYLHLHQEQQAALVNDALNKGTTV